MEANSCWSSTPPRESLGCGVAARGNKHHVRSLLASLPGKSGACGATAGTPITPWALLVMFGGVRETLLPSAPSPGTNLGADMQGGQGQIHYKYSTIVLTTKYKCTTDSRQHTNTLQIQCNIHIQGEGPGAKGQTAPGVRSEDPLPSSF